MGKDLSMKRSNPGESSQLLFHTFSSPSATAAFLLFEAKHAGSRVLFPIPACSSNDSLPEAVYTGKEEVGTLPLPLSFLSGLFPGQGRRKSQSDSVLITHGRPHFFLQPRWARRGNARQMQGVGIPCDFSTLLQPSAQSGHFA